MGDIVNSKLFFREFYGKKHPLVRCLTSGCRVNERLVATATATAAAPLAVLVSTVAALFF